MEAMQVSCDSPWAEIEAIHNSARESISTRSVGGMDQARGRANTGVSNQRVAPLFIEDVSVLFMKENKFCIRFQTDNCRETGDHEVADGRVTLKHQCAYCAFIKKPVDNSHGSKTCPHKNFGN